MLDKEAYEKLSTVIACLDDLINGKFILADNKVSKILKAITESEEMYGLMYECLKNFNKDREFSRAFVKTPTKPGYVVIPEDDDRLLPFVFCILVDIDEKRIDFKNFLNTFFKRTKDADEYKTFVEELIEPFRNIISDTFDISAEFSEDENNKISDENEFEQKEDFEDNFDKDLEEENDEDEPEINDVPDTEFFLKVRRIVNEMASELGYEKKKSQNIIDTEFILNGIKNACDHEDMLIVNALVTSLHYVARKIKSLKFLLKELDDAILEFYGVI